MLPHRKAVRHPSNKVSNRPRSFMPITLQGPCGKRCFHFLRLSHVFLEQLSYDFLSVARSLHDPGMPVQMLEEEPLEYGRALAHLTTEAHQNWELPHLIGMGWCMLVQRGFCGVNDVVHLRTQHPPYRLVQQAALH